MKTADLVSLLAAQVQPVPSHSAVRRIALAVAAALPVSLAWLLLDSDLRPGLFATLGGDMPWMKILLPATIGGGSFMALERLARPGVGVRAAWLGIALPVFVMWTLGLLAWFYAPLEATSEIIWGHTWRTCIVGIPALSLPFLVSAFIALRGLAPTRPAVCGAAAGALAGGAGAAVYALQCPEVAAPFLAIWYVLGMAIPAAAGALLGARWLRW